MHEDHSQGHGMPEVPIRHSARGNRTLHRATQAGRQVNHPGQCQPPCGCQDSASLSPPGWCTGNDCGGSQRWDEQIVRESWSRGRSQWRSYLGRQIVQPANSSQHTVCQQQPTHSLLTAANTQPVHSSMDMFPPHLAAS